MVANLVVVILHHCNNFLNISTRMGCRVIATILLIAGTISTSLAQISNDILMSTSSQNTQKKLYQLNNELRSCQKSSELTKLRQIKTSQFLTTFDISTGVLQFTDHSVIASGHHRNQYAMRDVIASFALPPEKAYRIFVKRNVDYLLTCDASSELITFKLNDPNGLWAQLEKGNRPYWIEKPQLLGPYKIWKINLENADPKALAK